MLQYVQLIIVPCVEQIREFLEEVKPAVVIMDIVEYLLPPVGVQTIAPPLAKSSEQIRDIFLGIWLTTVSSLSIATAYQSASLNGSLSHKISSPIDAFHRSLYTW